MRSIILFCGLLIAVGVYAARYADKAIVNPVSVPTNSQPVTMSRQETMRVVTAPLPPPSSQNPTRTAAAPPKPPLPQVITNLSAARTVTLRDDGSGHFRTDARVDGRRIEFLIDTGASAVVLRASTAAQLGIHPNSRDYTAKVITANGETRAAMVYLNVIEVGDITVRDVRALVQPDEALQVNLLGMTFLSRVRWSHDRGKLVIEQ